MIKLKWKNNYEIQIPQGISLTSYDHFVTFHLIQRLFVHSDTISIFTVFIKKSSDLGQLHSTWYLTTYHRTIYTLSKPIFNHSWKIQFPENQLHILSFRLHKYSSINTQFYVCQVDVNMLTYSN